MSTALSLSYKKCWISAFHLSEIWNIWLYGRYAPKSNFLKKNWFGWASREISEMWHCCYFVIINYFVVVAYRSDPLTDFHMQWLKKCRITLYCTFWGYHNLKFRVTSPPTSSLLKSPKFSTKIGKNDLQCPGEAPKFLFSVGNQTFLVGKWRHTFDRK